MTNRAHSKVDKLPDEIKDQVQELLVKGSTIAEIVDHLQDLAHKGEIRPNQVCSKSSVGRYSKGYLRSLERIKVATQQSAAICKAAGEKGLEMEQAAVYLVINELMRVIMPDEGEIDPETVAKAGTAIAKLQTSGATRERVKILLNKERERLAQETAKAVDKTMKQKGLSPEVAQSIREQILGVPSEGN